MRYYLLPYHFWLRRSRRATRATATLSNEQRPIRATSNTEKCILNVISSVFNDFESDFEHSHKAEAFQRATIPWSKVAPAEWLFDSNWAGSSADVFLSQLWLAALIQLWKNHFKPQYLRRGGGRKKWEVMQIMKMHISPGVSWLAILKKQPNFITIGEGGKVVIFFFFFWRGVCLRRGNISCPVAPGCSRHPRYLSLEHSR